jgi:VWFA-related protein
MQESPARPAGEKRDTVMTRTILLLGAALLFAVPAGAQSQAPPTSASPAGAPQQAAPPENQARSRIIVQTNTVIVPVTVKDSLGRLVGDLRRDEFRIFADGVEQQIAYFSAEPVPLSAVLLIDNDLPQGAAKQVQKSLKAIAAGFGAPDEVAVVTYDQFPETLSDFSSNNDQLFTQLKRLEISSHSTVVIADPTTAGPVVNGRPLPTGTGIPLHGSQRYKNTNALNDALFAAGEMLKDRGRDRRKMIFLISEGANSKHNEHTFDETLRRLLFADVSVFSISVTRTVPLGRSLLQRAASEIEKYATDTGGDVFFASKQRDLERLYSDVTEQARNEYTLAFSPQDIHKEEDYHSIEVRVRRPDLNVTARQGYYQSAMTVGR